MAAKHLSKLAALGGPALASDEAVLAPAIVELAGASGRALLSLLQIRNGFYAFESSLHVFPAGTAVQGERTLGEWNSQTLWRSEYKERAEGLLFFAEDAFGGQFCLGSGKVLTFDPETGDSHELAVDLDSWARALLADYKVLTGQPLAHAWQRRHGPLAAGKRLVPKTPFVLGGEFSVENLVELDAVQGMRARADIAAQIRDLPEGAKVKLTVI